MMAEKSNEFILMGSMPCTRLVQYLDLWVTHLGL
uniref:Uncharacterized protein n=1 Tax=Anguilla anguilla TaxID=7936 RepID=A0A0E9Q065_ANGAN